MFCRKWASRKPGGLRTGPWEGAGRESLFQGELSHSFCIFHNWCHSCFLSTWHDMKNEGWGMGWSSSPYIISHHYRGNINHFPFLPYIHIIPMITHLTSLFYCTQRHYSHRGSQARVRPASVLRPTCRGRRVWGRVEERRSRQIGHHLLRRCE